MLNSGRSGNALTKVTPVFSGESRSKSVGTGGVDLAHAAIVTPSTARRNARGRHRTRVTGRARNTEVTARQVVGRLRMARVEIRCSINSPTLRP